MKPPLLHHHRLYSSGSAAAAPRRHGRTLSRLTKTLPALPISLSARTKKPASRAGCRFLTLAFTRRTARLLQPDSAFLPRPLSRLTIQTPSSL